MTDGKGAEFRRMAIEAVKDDVGLGLWDQVQEWTSSVEVNGLDETNYDAERQRLNQELQGYKGEEMQISETETVYLDVENPAAQLDAKRGLGILRLVTEDEEKLSHKAIDSSILAGSRMEQGNVNSGNMTVEPVDGLWDKFLFQEYLLRYLDCYVDEGEEGALDYQIEYLIAGKDYDTDNLKSVANRLCALREAANVIYLMSDGEKALVIEAAALLICGVFSILPGLLTVVKALLLLGWAYAESVYDVKTLLSGGRVPLIKDKASWHYDLESALGGGDDAASESWNGLEYRDYLRIFMMLTGLDTLTERALDLVEADIRLTPGNAHFRLDACYTKVEAFMRIDSSFGYQFEILRERVYE